MRHALINQQGIVESIVIWLGKPWLPPEGYYCVYAPGIDVGDVYNFETNEFTKNITISQD